MTPLPLAFHGVNPTKNSHQLRRKQQQICVIIDGAEGPMLITQGTMAALRVHTCEFTPSPMLSFHRYSVWLFTVL